MRIEVEFRSKMSRTECFQALRISLEAALRLAGRMTEAELQKVENIAAALAAAVEFERGRRGPRQIARLAPAGEAMAAESRAAPEAAP